MSERSEERNQDDFQLTHIPWENGCYIYQAYKIINKFTCACKEAMSFFHHIAILLK